MVVESPTERETETGPGRCLACLQPVSGDDEYVRVHGAPVHLQCAASGIYEDVPSDCHVERLRRSRSLSPQ